MTQNKLKLLTFILIFSFILPLFPAQAASYDNIGLASAELNSKTGKFISGTNSDTILPLASLTKLMTALVLLDLKINLNKKVVITQAEVDYTLKYIAKGDVTSKIDLQAGDKVTKDNLWHAMLIASSNEAAVALVDNSGISRAQFIKRMNSKAKAYGLKHTKFFEPSGIDPNNVSTAKEMAVIARHAYANISVRQTSATPSYKFKEINSGRTVSIYSRNNSLLAMKPLGIKVGYLKEAKDNCAVRLSKNGKDRVIVILHSPNNARRNAEINRLMSK
jgi:D-alanyl-D-alanine endopeptidase (penicillin-binding protein 7)